MLKYNVDAAFSDYKVGFDMCLPDEHGHFIQVRISKFGNRLSVLE